MGFVKKNKNIRLLHGDCLELMKRIPDNSIDMILTSPPYDNLREYNKSSSWDFNIFKNIAKGLQHVLKKGGVIVWIVGDATVKGSESGSSFKQALYFKEIGFNLHDTMIWNKGNFTAVGALKTRYAQVFEYMFVFLKGKLGTFNPIKDRVNISHGRKVSGTVRQKDGSTKPITTIGREIPIMGQRHNIWLINPEKSKSKRFHPAMFPESLVSDHISSWSNMGDTILDPFMGSGTTGVVCGKMKRNFIGIEKDLKYFEIAKIRINNIN